MISHISGSTNSAEWMERQDRAFHFQDYAAGIESYPTPDDPRYLASVGRHNGKPNWAPLPRNYNWVDDIECCRLEKQLFEELEVPMETEREQRIYFAAHAPTDVPEWFKHDSREKDYGVAPKWQELPEAMQDAARSWLDDAGDIEDDAPAELQAFRLEWKMYFEGRDEWQVRDKADRFFQWRWYYADQMLAAGKVKGAA